MFKKNRAIHLKLSAAIANALCELIFGYPWGYWVVSAPSAAHTNICMSVNHS